MKKSRRIGLVVGLVTAQLLLALSAIMLQPGNAAKEPFRRQERAAASIAEGRNPSPANHAAYMAELRLLTNHVLRKQFLWAGILFAFMLAVDGIGFYCWHQHCKQKAGT